MKYLLLALACALASIVVPGCTYPVAATDSGSAVDAATAVDANATDAFAGNDAFAGSDAGHDAAAPVDAAMVDAPVDPHDAAMGGDANIAACTYTAVDEVIVLCGLDYVFVSHFTSGVHGCPAFYAFDPDGAHFTDTASAIASDATCDATCEWHFATSVSRIWCGHRSGFETLTATGAGCADIYRFPEGYFPSVEAHDAAVPCP